MMMLIGENRRGKARAEIEEDEPDKGGGLSIANSKESAGNVLYRENQRIGCLENQPTG